MLKLISFKKDSNLIFYMENLKTLVDDNLKNIINKNIKSEFDLDEFIQVSSIDIPLGSEGYLIDQKFLPFNHRIREVLDRVKIKKLDLENGEILLKGHTYLIKCLDIDLTNLNYLIKTSPKSSIGRIDLHTRTIFDNEFLYDTISKNKKGELWIEITPGAFNVRVKKKIALSQIRIFEKEKSELEIEDLQILYKYDKPVKKNFYEDKIVLRLNAPKNELIGFEAIPTQKVIDIEKLNYYKIENFFKPINIRNKSRFSLEKDKFYILTTYEDIKVPENCSVEMIPFSHLIGELRVHYAGFFDPGFGGAFGSTGVLEIRTNEVITVCHKQPICLIEVYENKKIPKKLYGEKGNNYQNQKGPKLAKYFKNQDLDFYIK